MQQKKVCLLGAFGVGKTSLMRRFVESVFADTYLTTVGVKVDKKVLDLGGRELTLVLWDVAGEDGTTPIRMSYVRGAAGYLLVADGTRPETLDVARAIEARVAAEIGEIPHVLLLNKADLQAEWALPPARLADVVLTSAKTGEGVEQAFHDLAKQLVR